MVLFEPRYRMPVRRGTASWRRAPSWSRAASRGRASVRLALLVFATALMTAAVAAALLALVWIGLTGAVH